MIPFEEEFAAYCAAHGMPERLELLLCDINGVWRGKWLPSDQVLALVGGKVRLPLSTYAPSVMGPEVEETGLGIVVGDPDGVLRPLPGTLKPVPWSRRDVAQVQVEMCEMGKSAPSALSTRATLERAVQALGDMGYTPVIATELEFYLCAARDDRDAPPSPIAHTPDIQNYDLEAMERHAPLLIRIQDYAKAQGLATDTLIAEYGPGQFEINFHHSADALQAADTALLFRRLVRATAHEFGVEATFMAKPYVDQPGNGMHAHVSLLNASGEPVFYSKSKPSPLLLNAVSGLLSSMSELQAIFAPHYNSFRRFSKGSFAPTTPDWGMDNRAVSLRLPQTTGPNARLEHRISGADVNPYLALAAILQGMAKGLAEPHPLPEPLGATDETQSTPLSDSWPNAVNALEASDFAKEVLGALHPVYLAVKRAEMEVMKAEITPAEYRYSLSRF
ncbi:MAG: glutamine synthetase family protein [Pseudomonadota bacterium]